MITHGPPAAIDAGPNLLKISESAFCGACSLYPAFRRFNAAVPRAGPVRAGFCHEDLFMSDSAMPTGALVA